MLPMDGPATGTGEETIEVADAALAVGDPTEAARLYERASEGREENAQVLLGLGRSYMQLGQLGRAENALLRAAQLAPRDPAVPIELGRLALQRRQPEQAMAQFDRALTLDRRSLGAITGKALSLDYLSRHSEAQAVYRMGLDIYPTNFALLNNQALSMVLSGRIGQGIVLLEELVTDPQRGNTARTNMAIAYALEGRERDARAMLTGTMPEGEIAADLAYYRKIRTDFMAGRPVGHLVFR